MMKRSILVIMGLMICLHAAANDKDYDVVYNYVTAKFEVADLKKTYYTYEAEYVVNSPKGKDKLIFNEFIDKNRSLENVDIKYIVQGKLEKRVRLKDLYKIQLSESFVESGFNMVYSHSSAIYPVTVQVKYTVKTEGSINYPRQAIVYPNQLCKNYQFTAVTPENLGLRYRLVNLKGEEEVFSQQNKKVYQWIFKDVSLDETEIKQPYNIPLILMAPNDFSFYNYKGNASTWESLSSFFWHLWKDESTLPADHISFLKELTRNEPTDRDKTRKVYEYLQKNFRYISIQLGIGGFKPFSATATLNSKYGDCKALSNYMYSALKAINIESYPVVIWGGDLIYDLEDDFTIDYTNHIILVVPNKGDSIWLECTSKTTDFGVLGSFTENRKGYTIQEKGGRLIQTPVSTAENNVLITNTQIQLHPNGSANVHQQFNGKGDYADLLKNAIQTRKDLTAAFLMKVMNWKQPSDLVIDKNNAAGVADLSFTIDNYHSSITSTNMFFNFNPYYSTYHIIPYAAQRKYDFKVDEPYTEIDTLIIDLPASFHFNSEPNRFTETSKWGSFDSEISYNAAKNQLIITSKKIFSAMLIKAEDFSDVIQWQSKIMARRTSRIGIAKK